MSRSFIQLVNQSPQNGVVGGIINLGSVLRRFGNNLGLSGNGIEASGEGYYSILGCVTIEPTATGIVTVAVYKNGVQIPGIISSGSVSTAENPVTLPLLGAIRQGCCDGADNITCVLLAGPGTITNVSFQMDKK